PVLGTKFYGRSPDHDLGIPDIDVPPASRAPFGGNIMADPVLAYVENQRLAAGAARVISHQTGRTACLEQLGIRADQGLSEQRNCCQVIQVAYPCRIE